MPSDYKVEVDAKDVVRRLEGVNGFMRKPVSQRLRKFGQRLRDELRREIPKRSGRARRGVFSKLERKRKQNDVTVIVGANLKKAPHLRVLEEGATIVPKRASRLAIPIGRAQTRAGVGRFSAAALRDNPEAFGYADSFVRRDVVFGVRSSGRVDPLFALRKRVVLYRRSYFKNKARQRRGAARLVTRRAVREGLRLAVLTGGNV